MYFGALSLDLSKTSPKNKQLIPDICHVDKTAPNLGRNIYPLALQGVGQRTLCWFLDEIALIFSIVVTMGLCFAENKTVLIA